MSVTWTGEQQQVIDARGQDLLVSAAAGSGKTAVLVERILKIITDEKKPVDIDRLLVVTFTNAAASEMRGRIRDALEERAGQDPDNVHLQRQLVLVHNAKITTIHSFCLHVLRNHFQTIGIDPSFRIADEGEVLLLEQDAVKEIVDEAYAVLALPAGEFTEFLEQYATGKSDANVEEMILKLYHCALGQPFPEEWLRECRSVYENKTVFDSGTAWIAFVEQDTALRLSDVRGQLQAALRIVREPDGPYPYEKALISDLTLVERLERGKTFAGYLEAFQGMGSFEALGRKKDETISEEKKQLVSSIRGECKDQLTGLRDQYYYDDLDALHDEFLRSGTVVRVLTKLTEAFMERLSKKKADKNILDFGDMEHMALNALVTRKKDRTDDTQGESPSGAADGRDADTSERIFPAAVKADGYDAEASGRIFPTAVAMEYAETFEEVMIDEYQDSNLVQELILSSVSGKGCQAHNRFMVGDVKQSIYRFRLARPELFMEKYHRYQIWNDTSDGAELPGSQGTAADDHTGNGEERATSADFTERRIDLHRNFRSRPQVLHSVNFIFEQIMRESLGGVEYDADAALYPGASFPEPEISVSVDTECPIPASSTDTDKGTAVSEKPAKSRQDWYQTELLLMDGGDSSVGELREEEAKMIGRRIRELVGTTPVLDKESGGFRPARYGDIVILLRTISGWGETFGEVLSDMGIPCFTGSQKGYFSAAEVRVVLSYLQILDNPLQDIPLAAVLRSPIGRFSDEELSRIRLAGEGEANLSFYDCCLRLVGQPSDGKNEGLKWKLEQFFATWQTLRDKCDHTPIHLLLWEILDVTGYGEYAAALPAGRQRKANLDMLVEKAIAYEATSYRGLYHFVRYIENLQKYEVDYGEASLGSEAGDTVRIMSIHKSKGLEFPIVFVGGMGKQFNEIDVRGAVVMHPEWGIACDCVWHDGQTPADICSDDGSGLPPAVSASLSANRDKAVTGENAGRPADARIALSEPEGGAIPRMRRPTLLKKTIQQKLSTENLGEELRVLYVAMTRAKEKLILAGSVKNLEKKQTTWRNASLSYSWLSGASTYLDWVVPAMMSRPGVRAFFAAGSPCEDDIFAVSVFTPAGNDWKEESAYTENLLTLQELLNPDPSANRDDEARKYLERVFSSGYPYEEDRSISGKYSVSELKKMSQRTEENDAMELYEEETVVPLLPRFERPSNAKRSSNDGRDLPPSASEGAFPGRPSNAKRFPNDGRDLPQSATSGAERGTAYHTLMENLDYSKKEDLRFQLEELISCGKMSEEEASSINLSEISAFLRSSIGQRMERACAACMLFREQPFVLGVPAGEILKNDSKEIVLVQGIIDAWFVEEEQIILVDYKTDRVSSKWTLIERYRTQIDYYTEALERLTGKKVRDRVIYSFTLGEEIYLPG
ncbi:MAG: UvrD-helicase domain-containing protein [Lachnospiraceae bacterium]|nr:UvrD-helicase domain-containing protein [Lachnospiraceae bacterium]